MSEHGLEEGNNERSLRQQRSTSRQRKRRACSSVNTENDGRRDWNDDHNDNSAVVEQQQQTTTIRRHHNQISSLNRRPTQGPIKHAVDYSSLLCGISAGVIQAGVFNPYDRALYVSVKHNRNFFHAHNWQRPYTGLLQSLGGRALQGGLYFPVEHFFLRYMDPVSSTAWHNFAAGTAAGAVNAVVLNPISAIKYKTWGKQAMTTNGSSSGSKRNMWRTMRSMLHKSSGSLRPFLNGLGPTLYRDVVFGGCYTWLRLQIQAWWDLTPQQQYQANLVAAALATVVSGPFNYARNIQYSVSSRDKADGTWHVLRQLLQDAQQIQHPNGGGSDWVAQLRFLQQRLRIGWGTARVAAGMTLSHAVYDWLDGSIFHNNV